MRIKAAKRAVHIQRAVRLVVARMAANSRRTIWPENRRPRESSILALGGQSSDRLQCARARARSLV